MDHLGGGHEHPLAAVVAGGFSLDHDGAELRLVRALQSRLLLLCGMADCVNPARLAIGRDLARRPIVT